MRRGAPARTVGAQTAWVVAAGLLAVILHGAPTRADGLVATQTAAPACPNGSGDIYIDCGNGTVTDTRSGLVWLKSVNCFAATTWDRAMEAVAGLADLPESMDALCGGPGDTCDCGLSDGSSPGEWRLPTAGEWKAMKADAEAQDCLGEGQPRITSDDGLGCWNENDALCVSTGTTCSFDGIDGFEEYWAANPDAQNKNRAFFTDIDRIVILGADIGSKDSFGGNGIWPVRGGQ